MYRALLENATKKLPKAKPAQAHALLFDAFKVAALSGDSKTARRLLDIMYGVLPPPKKVVTALSTHAIDVYSYVAGFGDLTRGQPTFAYAFVSDGELADRVAAIERGVRVRVTSN